MTSGLRFGTPAITTRGFDNETTVYLTNLICDVLDNIGDESKVAEVKAKVVELCNKYPVYS